MRGALKLLIAAIVALGLLSPVLARDISDAEKGSLKTTISAFDTAVRGNDYERMIDALPPKMFAKLAADHNLTVEQLRAATIEQSKQTMAQVTFVSFVMDVDKARYDSAGDDLPYALVPTETVMKLGNDKIKATGDTLALLDSGTWYLIRVSEAQQAELLKSVYPAFADVVFTPGKMEKVAE